MATLTEVTGVQVTAPWLGKTSVLLTCITTVGSDSFIKLNKSDARIERLFVGEAAKHTRKLAKAPVFDDIVKLRNSERDRLIAEATRDKSQEDLGIDGDDVEDAPLLKRRKLATGVLPEVVEIKCPAVDSAEETVLKVMLGSNNNDPLMVELSSAMIDYIRAAIMCRLRGCDVDVEVSEAQGDGDDEAVGNMHSSPMRGVYWIASKVAWRVKYEEGEKFKYRHFKPASTDCASVQSAAERACAFAESVGLRA